MDRFSCYKCQTIIECDFFDWEKNIDCTNCGKKYHLECDRYEPDYECDHSIVQDDSEDK